MDFKLLESINSPEDLKNIPDSDIPQLCEEIREFLINEVGKTGGHLASNLGVTELTVAMHKVFDSPKDHFIFDVGHQSYIHKLLTGRRDGFENLRKPGGLSGFTSMKESVHDAFGAGHSSTSISAALGYAETDLLLGNNNYTVCVTGDGAYTGGMIHEAINNCKKDLRLIIILNENGMSISKNKGAFASYLSSARASSGYIDVKEGAKSFFNSIPLIGKHIADFISLVKKGIKKLIFRTNYFEDLGFYYIGPIDGNDYKKVKHSLEKAKKIGKCVFVHVITKKGKGYKDAELEPEVFHSVSCSGSSRASYHSVVADELINLAETDERVVAITAAMGIGTGLNAFENKFPKRYFDVGIAEMHALTFSAGVAANGFRPYAAIYSTFLQRGYDSLIHDIALQNLPVTILIDRAGIAASDGATHHGVFDVSFISHIPNTVIYSPVFYNSLRLFVRETINHSSLVAIRYPNSSEDGALVDHFRQFKYNYEKYCICDFDVHCPPKNLFVTYGSISSRVLEAKNHLLAKGIDVGILILERIKPFAPIAELLSSLIMDGSHVVYVEEGIKNGGAAMITKDLLMENRVLNENNLFEIVAIEDNFVVPEELCDIYDFAGLSSQKLAAKFLN